MGSTFVLVFGTIAAGVFLGVLIGRFLNRGVAASRLQEAFERGKEEAEVEKANLGVALSEELLKLRKGIEGVAQSYESTVRLVQERLGSSMKSAIHVEGPSEMQLSLDFDRSRAEELPQSSVDDSPVLSQPLHSDPAPELLLEPERVELEPIEAESLGELPPLREANGRDKPYSLQ